MHKNRNLKIILCLARTCATKDVRNLACQYAVKSEVTIPAGWRHKRRASSDWLLSFLKRNVTLSIRSPQATSLGRATNFNKHNVEMLFSKLAKVYDKQRFQCQDIYNVGESAVTTVKNQLELL
jgi:hypothetical protein